MKKGWLVAPKEHWPPHEGGLSMEVAGTTEDGRPLFCYVHSPAYQATQAAFEQCQATFDPNTIAALLQVSSIALILACMPGGSIARSQLP